MSLVKKLSFPLLASLLIIVVLFSGTYKSWIRISYEINKLEIIEKFCVNKEETTFKCEGKCHLKTTLDKVDEESKSSNKAENIPQVQLLLFNITFEKVKFNSSTNRVELLSYYDNSYSFLSQSELFHPPPKS